MAGLHSCRCPLYPRKPELNISVIDFLEDDSGTDIMQIAEGVNVQNIDETGSQAEVLKERGEHVHWVALYCNQSAKQPQKGK